MQPGAALRCRPVLMSRNLTRRCCCSLLTEGVGVIRVGTSASGSWEILVRGGSRELSSIRAGCTHPAHDQLRPAGMHPWHSDFTGNAAPQRTPLDLQRLHYNDLCRDLHCP